MFCMYIRLIIERLVILVGNIVGGALIRAGAFNGVNTVCVYMAYCIKQSQDVANWNDVLIQNRAYLFMQVQAA